VGTRPLNSADSVQTCHQGSHGRPTHLPSFRHPGAGLGRVDLRARAPVGRGGRTDRTVRRRVRRCLSSHCYRPWGVSSRAVSGSGAVEHPLGSSSGPAVNHRAHGRGCRPTAPTPQRPAPRLGPASPGGQGVGRSVVATETQDHGRLQNRRMSRCDPPSPCPSAPVSPRFHAAPGRRRAVATRVRRQPQWVGPAARRWRNLGGLQAVATSGPHPARTCTWNANPALRNS
jgi:hypothetical protein